LGASIPVSKIEYPARWANLIAAEAGNCIDVSGMYVYFDAETECSLGGALYGIPYDVKVTHVELVQDDDNLLIALWNGNTLVR